RKPPPNLPIADGRAAEVDALVVLAVGSDCNVGKMTAQLQLRDALVQRGHRTSFVATGQTGIFIEGWGIAVDAVVADFIAGAAEQEAVARAAEETGLPATDPVRFDSAPLVDAIVREATVTR